MVGFWSRTEMIVFCHIRVWMSYSVFSVDVCSTMDEVLSTFIMSSPHCHVERSAAQLRETRERRKSDHKASLNCAAERNQREGEVRPQSIHILLYTLFTLLCIYMEENSIWRKTPYVSNVGHHKWSLRALCLSDVPCLWSWTSLLHWVAAPE